jgi:hypothetical protein
MGSSPHFGNETRMRGIPAANKRFSAKYATARRIEGAHRHVAEYEGDTAIQCHKIRSVEDQIARDRAVWAWDDST